MSINLQLGNLVTFVLETHYEERFAESMKQLNDAQSDSAETKREAAAAAMRANYFKGQSFALLCERQMFEDLCLQQGIDKHDLFYLVWERPIVMRPSL